MTASWILFILINIVTIFLLVTNVISRDFCVLSYLPFSILLSFLLWIFALSGIVLGRPSVFEQLADNVRIFFTILSILFSILSPALLIPARIVWQRFQEEKGILNGKIVEFDTKCTWIRAKGKEERYRCLPTKCFAKAGISPATMLEAEIVLEPYRFWNGPRFRLVKKRCKVS